MGKQRGKRHFTHTSSLSLPEARVDEGTALGIWLAGLLEELVNLFFGISKSVVLFIQHLKTILPQTFALRRLSCFNEPMATLNSDFFASRSLSPGLFYFTTLSPLLSNTNSFLQI